jgi:hypothetical protein
MTLHHVEHCRSCGNPSPCFCPAWHLDQSQPKSKGQELLDRLRAAGGSDWDEVEDVDAFLREIRGCEPSNEWRSIEESPDAGKLIVARGWDTYAIGVFSDGYIVSSLLIAGRMPLCVFGEWKYFK